MTENKEILEAELKPNESNKYKKIKEFFESIYIFYYHILQDPFENFWWEIITLVLQYLQLIIYIFDDTVSLIQIKSNFNKFIIL